MFLVVGVGGGVVIVDVVFVVFVVLNVDVVVEATSKVDMRLLVMEVEFGWVVGWCMTHPPGNSRATILLGCC